MVGVVRTVVGDIYYFVFFFYCYWWRWSRFGPVRILKKWKMICDESLKWSQFIDLCFFFTYVSFHPSDPSVSPDEWWYSDSVHCRVGTQEKWIKIILSAKQGSERGGHASYSHLFLIFSRNAWMFRDEKFHAWLFGFAFEIKTYGKRSEMDDHTTKQRVCSSDTFSELYSFWNRSKTSKAKK